MMAGKPAPQLDNVSIHNMGLQIRLECLKIAAQRHSTASPLSDLVSSAEELARWVTGQAKAPVT